MIIKQKHLILHNRVESKMSEKTGKLRYELIVRDPLDDDVDILNSIYTYDESYKDMKVGTEFVIDLQLIAGYLKTWEGK